MHGKGKYSWPNGRRYEGEYAEDKKHGYGVYCWPDRRRYEGCWRDGKQNGKGRYYDKNGQVKYGIWRGGKKVKWITQEAFLNYVDKETESNCDYKDWESVNDT
eukprot:TRINITY_DN17470_c0_g1_i2.p3 TRINITY_DN17470_c0_g1~~TRINITY_DN17470_c0_g1_i2.p3  ORF type:complete len:103 (-),score=21.98 TRINITY_DN17470_c0_g1_i2:149-457(-)